GEYKVWVCNNANFDPSGCKTDNFKVREAAVAGQPSGGNEAPLPSSGGGTAESPSPGVIVSSPTGAKVTLSPGLQAPSAAVNPSPSELGGFKTQVPTQSATGSTGATGIKFTPELTPTVLQGVTTSGTTATTTNTTPRLLDTSATFKPTTTFTLPAQN